MSFLCPLRLSATAFALTCSVCCFAQAQAPKFTPPGRVLLNACQQLDSNDPSANARTDRTHCFRFIESALMMDRQQQSDQSERFRQTLAGNGSLTMLPVSFCYPYSTDRGIDGFAVSAVAKRFVNFLQSQPESKLERSGNSDDTEFRLLWNFLKSEYPCRSK